jgi:diketogulonate reductase-like aldo/keto reductase
VCCYVDGRASFLRSYRVFSVIKKSPRHVGGLTFFFCVGVTAPIVGTTSMKHLMDAIEAVNLKLTEDEIKSLEEPYVARGVMGHV